MIRIILLFLIVLTSSYSCKIKWEYSKSSVGCVIINGQKREFRYFIPQNAKDTNLPLLIGLHGGGGKPVYFEKYSRFSKISEEHGSYIVVYPKGKNKHFNDGRKSKKNTDDIEFISHLIDIIPHVIKEKVYVTGMSNGGLMAQYLACEIPNKLSGIAIIGATMSEYLFRNCKVKTPLNFLMVFGDKDTVFLDDGKLVNPLKPYQIRGKHIGVTNTLKFWSERNKCNSSQITSKINKYKNKWGKYKDDGTSVIVNDYNGCISKLRFYDVKGGGHRWPDKESSNGFFTRKVFNIGNASREINSADEIVSFFGLI